MYLLRCPSTQKETEHLIKYNVRQQAYLNTDEAFLANLKKYKNNLDINSVYIYDLIEASFKKDKSL